MILSTFAPNQILITEDNGNRRFKSYETTVCNIIDGKIKINALYWNGKQTDTTNKYLGTFLKIGTAGVKKYVNSAVESGLIELTDKMIKF